MTELITKKSNVNSNSDFQALLTKIATEYINVPLDQASHVMEISLKEVGEFVNADRSYIFDYNHTAGTTSNLYEYCKPDIKPEKDNLQHVPYELIPDWTARHFKGERLYLPDVNELPNGNLKKLLAAQQIKSLVTTPLMNGNVCTGFVGFDSVHCLRKYSDMEIELLEVFAQMVINLTLRIRREREFNEIKLQLQQSLDREIEISKMKTQFITMTSHQFRSPLTTIQASAELLNFGLSMQDFPNKGKMEKQLARIVAEVERMTFLMNDIRYMGRAETNRVVYEPLITDAAKLISELMDHQNFHPGDFRRPVLSITGQPRPMMLDHQLIGQMMVNLLSNALKYSAGRQTPEVLLQFKETMLRISVKDFGIGIPDQDIPHLFQSFFRGSNVDQINGTGLGLAIVKHIADLHHGRVAIISKLSAGTSVIVELDYNTQMQKKAN